MFEAFLAQLPRSTGEAAELLKYCDARVKGRTWAEIDADRPLRHAIEIRHPSFVTSAFPRLLRKYRAALVTADTAGNWPMLHDVTADYNEASSLAQAKIEHAQREAELPGS